MVLGLHLADYRCCGPRGAAPAAPSTRSGSHVVHCNCRRRMVLRSHLRAAVPIPGLLDRGSRHTCLGRQLARTCAGAASGTWQEGAGVPRAGREDPMGPYSVPLATLAAAGAVSTAFVVYPFPMTGITSSLGRRSWQAVSADVLAPRVKIALHRPGRRGRDARGGRDR